MVNNSLVHSIQPDSNNTQQMNMANMYNKKAKQYFLKQTMNQVYKDNLNLLLPRKKSIRRYEDNQNETELNNSTFMREADQNTEQQVFQ